RLLRVTGHEKQSATALGRFSQAIDGLLTRMDDGYKSTLEVALHHRPTVLAGSAALTMLAFLILPTIPNELLPQTDEGEVSVSARMPPGTRIERTEAVALQLEDIVRTNVPEAVTVISNAGGGGFGGGSGSSASVQIHLTPRHERNRTSDQIATDLRRVMVGLPGVAITTRASGGN